jgi:hypothetical protein
MAKPPRDRSATVSRTYFISTGTWQGRSLFQSERLAKLFLEMLFEYRFSHRAGQEAGRNKEIWQRGYVDHRIRDSVDFAHHAEYIRQNPVPAGLAPAPELFPYCSACPGFALDPPPQGLKPREG